MDEHNHADEHPALGSQGPATGPADERMDPAGQSLADALRVSFRLLTLIMVGVLIAFLLTGFKSVESNEKGIRKFFGRIVGTADEGAAYAWPFPVGQIEIVRTQGEELFLSIDDFWMHETPEDKGKPLNERKAVSDGLRPGWDGAVLTGDQNLLHLRLTCNYSIDSVVDYVSNTSDVNEILRSLICRATIHAAAKRTADGLLRREQPAFLDEIKKRAQKALDGLSSGIHIKGLHLATPTWPLKANRAYERYTNAISKAKSRRNQAITEANEILRATAGESTEKLVGIPWRTQDRDEQSAPAAAAAADAGQYNLIGQYSKVRRELAAAERQDRREQADELRRQADELMQRISGVLRSSQSTGRVSRVISEAKAYSASNTGRVKEWSKQFVSCLPSYRESKDLTLENLWAETRDRILNSPTVKKMYLPMGQDKTILIIGWSPEIIRQADLGIGKLKTERKKQEDQALKELEKKMSRGSRRRDPGAPPMPPQR